MPLQRFAAAPKEIVADHLSEKGGAIRLNKAERSPGKDGKKRAAQKEEPLTRTEAEERPCKQEKQTADGHDRKSVKALGQKRKAEEETRRVKRRGFCLGYRTCSAWKG